MICTKRIFTIAIALGMLVMPWTAAHSGFLDDIKGAVGGMIKQTVTDTVQGANNQGGESTPRQAEPINPPEPGNYPSQGSQDSVPSERAYPPAQNPHPTAVANSGSGSAKRDIFGLRLGMTKYQVLEVVPSIGCGGDMCRVDRARLDPANPEMQKVQIRFDQAGRANLIIVSNCFQRGVSGMRAFSERYGPPDWQRAGEGSEVNTTYCWGACSELPRRQVGTRLMLVGVGRCALTETRD